MSITITVTLTIAIAIILPSISHPPREAGMPASHVLEIIIFELFRNDPYFRNSGLFDYHYSTIIILVMFFSV